MKKKNTTNLSPEKTPLPPRNPAKEQEEREYILASLESQ